MAESATNTYLNATLSLQFAFPNMSQNAIHLRAHLLIVDDRPDEIRLLVEMLRVARYRISIAMDGRQAYARAVASAPDLILMDVCMPKADGFTACRLLKADPATAHIPIIFLSASRELDQRLEGLENGGVDYVLKPYAPEEVLARIRIHLGQRGAAHPPAGPSEIGAREHDVTTPLSSDQVLARAATVYLRGHLAAAHTLESVSRAIGTNEKRLSRIFRAHLGHSVFEFIRAERLHVARRLLAQTNLRIADVAAEVGFSNSANFATAFRERYSVTPTVFREVAALRVAAETGVDRTAVANVRVA